MPEPAAETIILANLGTPSAPSEEAVRAFLGEFLADPKVVDFPRWLWKPILQGIILRRRPANVAKLYESIWTAEGSPLDAGTRRMGAALAQRVGREAVVDIAYRYGEPSVHTALRRARERGSRRIVLVPLFPQRTGATTGTLIERAQADAASLGLRDRLRIAIPEPETPGYVAAVVAKLAEAVAAAPSAPRHLLISFHGIPVRYDRAECGQYVTDCRRTAEAIVRASGWPREHVTLAYQSRFGPEKWLEPATAEVLAQLPARGETGVAVVTPGFVTDGLETIEEIGGQGHETFTHAGGTVFVRVPAPEDHPSMIDALLDAARTDA